MARYLKQVNDLPNEFALLTQRKKRKALILRIVDAAATKASSIEDMVCTSLARNTCHF